MDKKLPRIFVNNIGKINNNEEVFKENKIKNLEDNEINNGDKITKLNNKDNKITKLIDINKKINQIFSSSNYVYKANVNITTRKEILSKKIIGRNKNYLITMDNELINIDDIIDIEFKKTTN